VGTFDVVLLDPRIQIGLQLLQRRVDLLAKRNELELLLHGPVKSARSSGTPRSAKNVRTRSLNRSGAVTGAFVVQSLANPTLL
jgi:hypothetical protein